MNTNTPKNLAQLDQARFLNNTINKAFANESTLVTLKKNSKMSVKDFTAHMMGNGLEVQVRKSDDSGTIVEVSSTLLQVVHKALDTGIGQKIALSPERRQTLDSLANRHGVYVQVTATGEVIVFKGAAKAA